MLACDLCDTRLIFRSLEIKAVQSAHNPPFFVSGDAHVDNNIAFATATFALNGAGYFSCSHLRSFSRLDITLREL
jgi:hypothetical protein